MKPVWIVDDDRSIRWVIEKALSREGIPFSSFSTVQEALDALSGGAPEVLVSDIRMPGQSGLELLQTVKTRHPAVPVIVMTAYSDLDSAVAAFQGGAYEYLPKPFDIDQAVELIRRALDESRRESEAVEPVGETHTAEADRHRQWREVGVGAQILRDLGISSIRNLTSSAHDYKGLSGFGIEIIANERLEG